MCPTHQAPTKKALPSFNTSLASGSATQAVFNVTLPFLNNITRPWINSTRPSQGATPKQDCPVTAANDLFYGINDEGVVWETDVTCQTATQLMDAAPYVGSGNPRNPRKFNGVAYDSRTTGGILYALNSDGEIVAIDRVSKTAKVVATSVQLNGAAAGNPSNGAWYLDSYWFVETTFPPHNDNQATIYRVAFDSPAAGGDGFPTFKSLDQYTISFDGDNVRVGFGDIAFSKNGALFLGLASVDGAPANPTAPLYEVADVAAMISASSATATKIRATGVDTKQLAFDQAGTTLWTHDHNTCMWGTMDVTTGLVTDVFQGPACLRDIGGAAVPLCTLLPSNCGTGAGTCFNGTGQTCATCNVGYHLDAGANTCTACTALPANCGTGAGTCFSGTTGQTCATCNGGYQLNAGANTCTALVARLWTSITSSSDGTKLAAVVNNGYIYTSTDSGVTWTARTGPSSRGWTSITSSSDGTKLAAVATNIYTSTDSGVTWIARSGNPPAGGGTRGFTSITFSSDGTTLAAASPSAMLLSIDSGNTWTTKGTANGLPSNSMKFITSSSNGTKLAATSTVGIGLSVNSGATWTYKTTTAGLPSNSMNSITSSSDGTMLAAAATSSSNIYTSTDSGLSWTQQASSYNLVYKSITSSSDGTKLAAVVNGGYIYTNTDSGGTWTARTGAGSLAWSSITSSSDGTKLAAVVNNGYVYTSTDSGVTWTARSP